MTILDDIRATIEVIEAAKPELYYTTSDAVALGRPILIKANHGYPDVWVMHPDDFEQNKKELAHYCRLIHFRDWKPTPGEIQS